MAYVMIVYNSRVQCNSKSTQKDLSSVFTSENNHWSAWLTSCTGCTPSCPAHVFATFRAVCCSRDKETKEGSWLLSARDKWQMELPKQHASRTRACLLRASGALKGKIVTPIIEGVTPRFNNSNQLRQETWPSTE